LRATRSPSPDGSSFGAASAITIDSGTSSAKASRQALPAAKTPPMVGPRKVAMPQTAA
jgi:hypothetical protein